LTETGVQGGGSRAGRSGLGRSGAQIVLFGQRRSGTTLAFELFRRCSGLTCFYEPLHPRLLRHRDWQGEADLDLNPKGAFDEYQPFRGELEKVYAPLGAPVYPVEQELDDRAWTERHSAYLARLAAMTSATLLQPVRANHHLARIREALPEAFFVWVLRAPQGVVASQLSRPRDLFATGGDAPQVGWNQSRAADAVIARRPWLGGFRDAPSWLKLMALWYDHLDVVSTFRASIPDERFAVLRYEDLCSDPDSVIGAVCEWVGVNGPASSLSEVPSPEAGAVDEPADPRWQEGRERLRRALLAAGRDLVIPETEVPPASNAAAAGSTSDAARSARNGSRG
jgi:hypothetical protein